MKKITLTLIALFLTLAAYGGWETAGLFAPQPLLKIKFNCQATNNSGPLGVRYPVIAYDDSSKTWYIGTGALTPTAPIQYELIQKTKTVINKKSISEYYTSLSKIMRVKIVRDIQQNLKAAAVKEASSINYVCQPAKASAPSETDAQSLFDNLINTSDVTQIPFIEYSLITVQSIKCGDLCTGIDSKSGKNFTMNSETSKKFKQTLASTLLSNTKQTYTLPLDLVQLSVEKLDCSAGYDMGAHREFSKCEIVW